MSMPPERLEATLADQLDCALDAELLRVVGIVHLELGGREFDGIVESVRRETDDAPVVWTFDEPSRCFDITARPAFLRALARRPEVARMGLGRSPRTQPPS